MKSFDNSLLKFVDICTQFEGGKNLKKGNKMAKKVITYPNHLNINMGGKGNITKYTLNDYIVYLLNGTKAFNQTGKGIRSSARIEAEILKNIELEAAGTPVETLVLISGDWEILASVCEDPDCLYPLSPARILIPFIDAILNATEIAPPEKEEASQA